MRVQWYFDFISPYSYFASLSLQRLPASVEVVYRPVLFAGLLSHWGQKGPAEIASKRLWTYRSCVWHARQHGIAFRMPAAHPFNPLPYLRLCVSAGVTPASVRTLFDALWTTGCDPADAGVLKALAERLQVDLDRLADPTVKESLRVSTDEAVQAGVFGVPTLRIGQELFWGNDGLDLALAYLGDPTLFDSPEMRRAAHVPVGVARPGTV
ncbi:MAG: 2-hydroxychromene-2-carboxylate isomerase [Steroidobacteraceae bacterium]